MAAQQVVADAVVLAWGIVWFVIGRVVDGAVRSFAAPARRTAEEAAAAAAQFRAGGQQAGSVPGVGDGLSRPFDEAATTMDGIAATARELAGTIELAATLGGLAVFIVPVLLAVGLWLPRRLAHLRRTRSARDLATTEAGLDLLALRALATQPVGQLRGITNDPVQAWRDGDLLVVSSLADLELRSLGLRRPTAPRTSPTDVGTPGAPETSAPTSPGDQE